MKMRRVISFVILAVYSIVMAHNFIPHHHHSELNKATHYCKYDVQDNLSHQHEFTGSCCLFHSHDDQIQNPCGFDDETIILKSTDLQDLFISASTAELTGIRGSYRLISGIYIQYPVKETPLGSGILRGPPLLT